METFQISSRKTDSRSDMGKRSNGGENIQEPGESSQQPWIKGYARKHTLNPYAYQQFLMD
jgi:hypothetical protein